MEQPAAEPAAAPGPAPAPAAAPAVDLAKHPSGIVPQLQNVVCTVNLGCKLDLKEIALHARNAEYNPKRFAAVIMRIRDPKTTALIFASGKMVCTGARSEDDARTAARKYAKIVQKLNFPAQFKEFKVQNIVGTCDVKFPIRLEGLAFGHQLFSNYEPELFPGLIYRMQMPKVVLLIFVSGKVVLTGAKFRDDIYSAFESIYPTLQQFRKGDAANPAPPMALMPPPMAALPAPSTGTMPAPSASHGRQQQGGAGPSTSGAAGPSRAAIIPPPSPMHQLPPPTPLHQPNLPPPTPLHHSLPPPTPMHHSLPPPTPLHPSNLPPPTPLHTSSYGSGFIPPPTPQHQ